jgi:hypothetical protein
MSDKFIKNPLGLDSVSRFQSWSHRYHEEFDPSIRANRIRSEVFSPKSPDPVIDNVSWASSGQPKTYFCRLCNNDTSFKDEEAFDVHLTVIHFKDRLMKKIQPPFRCLECGHAPKASMSPENQCEDLLMHYGCAEKFAARFYHEEVAKLPQLKTEQRESDSISIVCKLCESLFDSERLFARHISLRHFPKQLCDELPKSEPYICPFLDCGQEASSIHNLMLHYGCEHNISMELYQKQTTAQFSAPRSNNKQDPVVKANNSHSPMFDNYLQKTTANKGVSLPIPVPSVPCPSPTGTSTTAIAKPKLPIVLAKPKESPAHQPQFFCKECPDKNLKFSAKPSLNFHILFSHLFPEFPQSGPCECPVCLAKFSVKNVFAHHFLENHFDDFTKKQYVSESKISSEKPRPKLFLESELTASEKRKNHSSDGKDKHKSGSSSKQEERLKSKHDSKSSSSSRRDSKSKDYSKERKSESKAKDSTSKSSASKSSSKEKEEKSSSGNMPASNENDEIPACRVRKTFHVISDPRSIVSSANTPNSISTSARQRLMENWCQNY